MSNAHSEQYKIPISFFKSKTATGKNRKTGKPDFFNESINWSGFVGLLRGYSKVEYAGKESAPLYSPTIYQLRDGQVDRNGKPYLGYRCEANATVSALAPLDMDDNGMLYEQGVQWLSANGLEGVVYTTASNIAGEHFRIVIPLAEPVDIPTQKRTIRAIVRELGYDPDRSKTNPYSMFYVAGNYKGADNKFAHIEGRVRSAAEWCERNPEPEIEQTIEQYRSKSDLKLDPKAKWSFDTHCQDRLAEYRGLSSDRYPGLCGLGISMAMSARTFGYALSRGELAGFLDQEQAGNPPSSKDNRRSRAAIGDLADYCLDKGNGYVSDPLYLKWQTMPRMAGDTDSVEQMIRQCQESPPTPEEIAAAEAREAEWIKTLEDEPPRATNDNTTTEDAEDPTRDVSEPFDLFGSLTPEPVMTRDMLPRKIGDYVWEMSDLLGCDPGAMAVSALALCSGLISDQIKLQPKRHDTTYLEVARIWLMLVGSVSAKKTPMFLKLFPMVKQVENRMRREDAAAIEKYKSLLAQYELKKKSWDKRVADNETEASSWSPEKPEKPPRRRLIANDYTKRWRWSCVITHVA
jgi:hypothetical protein